MSDIRSAYLNALAGLHASHRDHDQHAEPIITVVVAQLEEAVRGAQRAGTVRESLDPRRTAELMALFAMGLVAWYDLGVPIDVRDAGDTLVHLIENPPAQ